MNEDLLSFVLSENNFSEIWFTTQKKFAFENAVRKIAAILLMPPCCEDLLQFMPILIGSCSEWLLPFIVSLVMRRLHVMCYITCGDQLCNHVDVRTFAQTKHSGHVSV